MMITIPIKYLESISIRKEQNGYTIFTIPTQHFKVKTLDELTPEYFTKMEEMQIEYQRLSRELFIALNEEN